MKTTIYGGAGQLHLFTNDDFKGCFFRDPTPDETDYMSHVASIWALLDREQRARLSYEAATGRPGNGLGTVFKIVIARFHFGYRTWRQTLTAVGNNCVLMEYLGLERMMAESTFSNLRKEVMRIVDVGRIHALVVDSHVGEAGIICTASGDSTIIKAYEKPIEGKREKKQPGKKGRKKKGSPEQIEHDKHYPKPDTLEWQRAHSPAFCIQKLEKRASRTAKQNSKGNKEYFIGYKAHMICDDNSVPLIFVPTGACVHDSRVIIPMMKMLARRHPVLYMLFDAGYDAKAIRDEALALGMVPVIDSVRRGDGKPCMDPAKKTRYKDRTTIERANSVLKANQLATPLHSRGWKDAHFQIPMSVLMLTLQRIADIRRQQQAA